MNQEDFTETLQKVLAAMTSDPPGKSKSIEDLVNRTGLNRNQVLDVIESLRENWEVSHINPNVE
jgi:hypothetical protein